MCLFSAERLNNLTIIVSDGHTNGLSNVDNWDSLNPVVCARYPGKAGRSEILSLTCETCVLGRYVWVTKPDTTREPLTLCEVEVYGEPRKNYAKSLVLGT